MKRILTFLALASCALAGTWIASPGKGSHAAAGGGSSVAIDTTVKSASGAVFPDSQTVAITVASNSNRILLINATVGQPVLASRTVDSVSSNVDGAFTHIAADADDANFIRSEWWYLKNPTAGAHTVTVVYATGSTSISTSVLFAVSLYNVNQTTPIGTAATSSGAGTTGSAAVTLASTDMAWGGVCTDGESSLTFTTGTERQKTVGVASDTSHGIASNTGTGSVSVAISTSPGGFALSVIPVAAAP